MTDHNTGFFNKSIATHLLTKVFSYYVLIAFTFTLVHLVIEYFHTEEAILRDLRGYHNTFEPALASALWQTNPTQLKATIDGMIRITNIIGVEVYDNLEKSTYQAGVIPSQNEMNEYDSGRFFNQYFANFLQYSAPIAYTDFNGKQNKLGILKIYSVRDLVFSKVQFNFVVILVNAFFKSLGLWIIFLIIANKTLRRPLQELIKATEIQDFHNLRKVDIELKGHGQNELTVLQDTYNKMIMSLAETRNGLKQLYDDLENRVNERTAEVKEKNELLTNLSRQLAKYLSPQVYQMIFEGKKDVKLGSYRRKLTVFFSDIVGFTQLTDSLESEQLTEVLNEYLNEMTQIALRYGGTLDKYIGDALMVFFGDPESRGVKEDAVACALMALEMRERMKLLQIKWMQQGLESPLQIRTGINSGYCTVGNFGSNERLDYTIIGGPVNLASRLESVARPGTILISHETYSLVKDVVMCQKKDKVHVKGFAYPVQTYEVVDYLRPEYHASHRVISDSAGFSLFLSLDRVPESEMHQLAAYLDEVSQSLKQHLKQNPEKTTQFELPNAPMKSEFKVDEE